MTGAFHRFHSLLERTRFTAITASLVDATKASLPIQPPIAILETETYRAENKHNITPAVGALAARLNVSTAASIADYAAEAISGLSETTLMQVGKLIIRMQVPLHIIDLRVQFSGFSAFRKGFSLANSILPGTRKVRWSRGTASKDCC